jgi:tRNA/rRNA methyltransferase
VGGSVALLFGSEKRGLSNEDLSHCHWLLRIPTRAEHRSMNLGQAVAVCLYEFARDSKAVRRTERAVAAASADLERITMVVLDALLASGYLKSASPGTPRTRANSRTESRSVESPDRASARLQQEKIRRLVRRLSLSAVDANLFLGILRQILWRLRSSDNPPR